MLKPKYFTQAPTKIVELLIAIASIVLKPKRAIATGIIRPPPPTPPQLAKPSRMGKRTIPPHSWPLGGQTPLCWHMLLTQS